MTRAKPSLFVLCLAVLMGNSAAALADEFLDNRSDYDGPIADPSLKNIPKFPPGIETAGIAVASPILGARTAGGAAACMPESSCAVPSPALDAPSPLLPVAHISKAGERAPARKRS